MTVLGLLREFENVKILGVKHLVQWNLEVELPNTFIGIVEEGNATIQVTWKSNLQYTYNIQPNSVAKSASRILLKFIVDGPPLLINFINDFLTRNEDPNTLYHLLPKTNFTILIEGESFQGIQFVYFKHLNIDVLKLSDLSLQVINGHGATAILILFIRNSVK